MKHTFVYLIALAALAAGNATAQSGVLPNPAAPQARAPAVTYQ